MMLDKEHYLIYYYLLHPFTYGYETTSIYLKRTSVSFGSPLEKNYFINLHDY